MRQNIAEWSATEGSFTPVFISTHNTHLTHRELLPTDANSKRMRRRSSTTEHTTNNV